MSDARRGLPLLSEPPPTFASPDPEIACRKCSKEFSLIFVRSRKCNHCGYSYCHTCSDFQALMPRPGSDGYDTMHVCGFCVEFLTITASGRNSLKALPLGKLKKYVAAYGIRIDRAVEKDDIIDAIVAARRPNGCLPPANENFYRKNSVPRASSGRTRGLFSRSGQSSSSDPPHIPPRPASLNPTYEFARPDLEPDVPSRSHPGPPPPYPPRPQEQRDSRPHPPSPPRQSRPTPSPHLSRPDRPNPPSPPNPYAAHTPPLRHQHSHYDPPPQMPATGPSHANSGSRGYGQGYGGHVPPTPPYMTHPQQQPPAQSDSHSPPRGRPYSFTPPQPQSRPLRPTSVAPPPNLDQLVEMSTDSIGSLSISALKSILFTNHVTAGQILEKSDLVKKVLVLVENEKAEQVRQRQMQEREEMERLQRAMGTMPGTNRFEGDVEEEEETEGQQQDGGDEEDQHANESSSDFDFPIHDDNSEGGHDDETHKRSSSTTPAATSPPQQHPKTTGPSSFERQGMCVICQDEDANIAIIDCGHMAMCRGCSDLVMASSKECPLCRTRIVTEARLLRIFRT